LHETSGLIDTAKELNVAFVAFSPLGHGWLVDDFPFKTPDDFAPNDFRRTGTSRPFDFAKILLDSGKLTLTNLSSQSSKAKTSTRTRLLLTKLRS
jgi:hypothetical protein